MNEQNRGSLRTYLLSIISLVTVIALLAASGFYHFEHGQNQNVKNFGDSLWWTMVTMTTIGYGDIFPVTLGGRLVAIFLMFLGIGTLGVSTAAIAAYFVKNDQLQLLRLRRLRDHVIICGLGNKGFLLAHAFRERGQDVVVLEKDEANPLIESCTDAGIMVLVGNATEPVMLTKARIQAARYLIAVCGDDGTNAEVAAHARELVSSRNGNPLTCSAHIVDPDLWYLLRHWEISTVGAFRMQFFNVFDLGARAMLTAHSPFNQTAGPPHLLIVGSGKLGQNMVLHATRLWREHHAGDARFRVTLLDRDTSLIKESLHLRRPGLERYCDLETLSLEITSPQFHHGAFLLDAEHKMSVTAIYICLENDGAGLSAALALLHRVRHHPVPIIVQMTRNAGLGTLLQAAQTRGHGFEKLHGVGLLERICQPELVLGGANEVIARAIHERYLHEQEKAGTREKHNPSLLTWDKLPEELKESNRRQADHIGLKLQSIGCDIAPLSDWNAGSFTFTDAEVEEMAKLEHDRWAAERAAQGWKVGPRDPANKTNPNLVPWQELPEATQEYNRTVVRQLPESLAHAGFQIYRLK